MLGARYYIEVAQVAVFTEVRSTLVLSQFCSKSGSL